MKDYCFIQTRLGSTRFPKKAIEELYGGYTVTEFVFANCKMIFPNVIAIIPDDEPEYCEFLEKKNIPYFAGDPKDVLKRYYDAAKKYDANNIIRVTGDCPLIDTKWLFYLLMLHVKMKFDFTSNCFYPRKIIDGNDCEIMSRGVLHWLNENTSKPEHREHVTKYIYDNQEELSKIFKMNSVTNTLDMSKIKTSIDTPEDLENVKKYLRGKKVKGL